jgi:hypothetical protein
MCARFFQSVRNPINLLRDIIRLVRDAVAVANDFLGIAMLTRFVQFVNDVLGDIQRDDLSPQPQ